MNQFEFNDRCFDLPPATEAIFKFQFSVEVTSLTLTTKRLYPFRKQKSEKTVSGQVLFSAKKQEGRPTPSLPLVGLEESRDFSGLSLRPFCQMYFGCTTLML